MIFPIDDCRFFVHSILMIILNIVCDYFRHFYLNNRCEPICTYNMEYSFSFWTFFFEYLLSFVPLLFVWLSSANDLRLSTFIWVSLAGIKRDQPPDQMPQATKRAIKWMNRRWCTSNITWPLCFAFSAGEFWSTCCFWP